MADKISSTKTVSMDVEFTDGDTRTITQNNPIQDQASLVAAINDFANYAKTNQLLIGDKTGAEMSYLRSAKVVEKNVIKYDLG